MPFLAFVRANAPFLAAGFLLAFLSSFGQTNFISIFAGELRETFGMSHGDWGTVYALGTLASAGVMMWAGALTDRFRIRALGAAVVIALACSCLAMAVNPLAGLLPLVIFSLRLFGQGMASHLSGIAMARWFVASRGRALSVAALGYAVGDVALPLGFVALKDVVHWRWLWVLGAVLLLAALPVLARLLRLERTPQSMANEATGLGMGGKHWTRVEVLRHPLFWMIVPLLISGPMFGTSFYFQQVHIAEVKGWAHLSLVALFPIATVAGIFAMMTSGWAVDRFGTARLMPFYPLPSAVFFLTFSGVTEPLQGAVLIVLLGLSSGSQATIPIAFWAEFYGTRNIGAIRATAGSLMVLGSAIGPVVTGEMIDRGVDFPSQMPWIAAYMVVACCLAYLGVARARKSLPPPQINVAGP